MKCSFNGEQKNEIKKEGNNLGGYGVPIKYNL
jgi:hypothetical protein